MILVIIEKEYIQKAKEKLGDEMAFIIAKEFPDIHFDETNLKMCCPFHEENTASFIWNKKALSFHCFGSCSRNYDIIDIFMINKGMTYVEAVIKLFELADIKYAFGEHKVKTKRQYNYPKEVLCSDKSNVYNYLNTRKISNKTTDYLDIREDNNGNCVFNYYDLNDTLTMVKYRPSRKITKKEPKNWCQKGADTFPLLYNMNRINTEQPLLICSGELDCASAIESGWTNAVSIPLGDGNLGWVKENFEWLEQFEDIIVCHDNDESGIKFCKTVVPMLGSWRCKVVLIPEFYEMSDNKKIKVKDLNEALYFFGKEFVLNLIVNAKDSPIPALVDFSDISDKDFSDMDGIKTGFEDIDKDIDKLFFGSFNIVSGTPGSGKTSFLYSLVCNAIDENVNSFIYSRELPEWMSKNWLMHILAGKRNHREKINPNGDKYYYVSKECKNEIDEYYKGRLVFYRDDYPNDSDSIMESMISSARKYGTKLFLIDNLTVVDIGASDDNKYEKQTQFVNELISFATKYQAVVILVCHPNKQSDSMQNVGMYQISGSSNLINLAHRAFGLRRVTKKEKEGYTEGRNTYPPVKEDVIFSIIKDRFGGKIHSEYGMFYDRIDRRFYSNQDEYDKKYKWDSKDYLEPLISTRLTEEDEILGSVC